MNVRDYLSVRRAYNIVRQQSESDRRLTFEEFAILCRLEQINGTARVTEIATYQHALRPTMAHRMDHLEKRDLVIRGTVPDDRRASWASLTAHGINVVKELSSQTIKAFPTNSPMRRITVKRLARMVDAMGAVFLTAGELLVLALMDQQDHRAQIGTLVNVTGFLQPTTSMAVSRLVESGLVDRCVLKGGDGRRTTVAHLTDEGMARAEEIASLVEDIVVRKERASNKGKAKDKAATATKDTAAAAETSEA